SRRLKVADRTHELYKKDVTGKILIFPYPIGTTTLGFVLLETIVRNVGPKAIVCEIGEPLMSSGAIIAEIFYDQKFPIVDKIEFSKLEIIENGTIVKVNGDKGFIEIL
ncbi:MAG: aconitase X swivel domain-containing protein, partial [Candidatus Heimdallarchaeota archaeon]